MLADDPARRGVIDERRDATPQRFPRLGKIIDERRIELAAACKGAFVTLARFQLMVAQQRQPAAVKIETGHAIHRARDDKAIGHPVASAGNDAVAEMFGQIENAMRFWDERSIALDLLPLGPRARSERLPVEARQGKTGKAARQQVAPLDACLIHKYTCALE